MSEGQNLNQSGKLDDLQQIEKKHIKPDFKIPSKIPQQIFQKTQANNQKPEEDQNKSQKSIKSSSSQEKRRKGSFLDSLSQKNQQQAQKLAQRKKQDAKSIFVQNVDYKTTKQELIDIFQDCGTITRVTILKDNLTKMSKGCAYVSFQTEKGVERALHLSGFKLRNRNIKVQRKRTNIYGMGKSKFEGDRGFGILTGLLQNTYGFRGRGRGRGRGGK